MRLTPLLFCFIPLIAIGSSMEKAGELIYSQLTSTEILIRVCTVLLILFTLFFISFFITLMVARSSHKYRDNYEKHIKEKFELLLTGIIFNDEEEMQTDEWKASKQRVVQHFKKRYLQKRINKKLLREHIVLMHKNFTGSAADVLRNLYIDLKLDRQALRELNSPDWGTQASAIQELAQLRITRANKKIRKLTAHENHILRLEAQIAILTMDEQDPFAFLAKSRNLLTEWHQVNLTRIIDSMDRSTLPVFSAWFNSKNDSIVEFCIKMTLQYDQFQSIPDLIDLLSHQNQDVVGEAARTLGEFGATEAQPMMLKAFRSARQDIKIKILTALGKCGTHELIPFLQQQLVQNDISIAFEAGKALKLLGEEGLQVLESNQESMLYGVGDICKHLLDDRI